MTSVALNDLGAWLERATAGADPGTTAVLAGHYAIFSGGAQATDLLDSSDLAGGPAEMLEFTRFTWDTACGALARTRGARLVVLVDDIQFVIPGVVDRRTQEQLAAALAAHYMRATPALPAFHARVLADRGLSECDVLKQDAARWTFSERELRIAHVRRVRELVRGDRAPRELVANDDLTRIVVTSAEHGEYCLVHSGRTTCAGGYVELLCALYERGVRRLFTLVPMRCLAPIAVGTELAKGLLALDGLSVVNVAIPDVASGLPAQVTPG
ncbi:MAG TPA: hypothetical protein VE967_02925 [Gemmatimonadaceae bacterium]|nr:hypothetical protein [Gemmatimonadaceae bacterium]